MGNDTLIKMFQLIGVLIMFSSILFLAYLTTRYVGKKTGRALKGKHISVVETMSLGLDKQLHLIKVGEQFLLISSSGKKIEFLTNLNTIENESEDKDDVKIFDFKNIFDKYIRNVNERGKKPTSIGNKDNIPQFSKNTDFKNNLNKLRDIVGKNDI